MQSTKKAVVLETSDKSFTEWPTLSDVCSNTRNPSEFDVRHANGLRKKSLKSPSETSGGYDSSKENEISPKSTSCRGARKKSSGKQKWVPLPIVPQPYKKRGNGRHFYDSRNGSYDRKNESGEFSNGQENGRNSVRGRGNNRIRGKRGRGGYSHPWRSRQDETSRGELENGSSDSTFDLNILYQNSLYYNPIYNCMLASALRETELKNAIRVQIEYYFSDDNLVKDIFIRRKMDSKGYLPIKLISTFNRVKYLTGNFDTIVEALKDSSKLELYDDIKVRPVINPLKWPLTDKLVLLRSDVPEFFPGRPYINSLVEGMDTLSITVNGDSFPQSPDSSGSLSPDQVLDTFTNEQAISGMLFYPENASSIEHIADDANYYTGSSVEPCITNTVDYYSQTPSPDDHVNGFDHYYANQISHGAIYYSTGVSTDDYVGNGDSFYYGSSPEVLSAATDNSVENREVDALLEGYKSPEPPR